MILTFKMIKKSICFILIGLFFITCKTKQVLTGSEAKKELAASKIIKEYYKNEIDFKTISIRANAKYVDPSQSQSVNADIRIKKDEIIWVNIKFLGFPVGKALITPEKVSYYEKINKTFFEGDYALLSNWLGTDLDFNKIQNLLLGKTMDDLRIDEYFSSIDRGYYLLATPEKSDIDKKFYFEASQFLLKEEHINQKSKNRSIEIKYEDHEKLNRLILPKSIEIKAIQEEQVLIDISYKNITFDEELNFSFEIPNGYDEIKLE